LEIKWKIIVMKVLEDIKLNHQLRHALFTHFLDLNLVCFSGVLLLSFPYHLSHGTLLSVAAGTLLNGIIATPGQEGHGLLVLGTLLNGSEVFLELLNIPVGQLLESRFYLS